jgi:hypothetical protein
MKKINAEFIEKILRQKIVWYLIIPLIIILTIFLMKSGDIQYYLYLLILFPIFFPSSIIFGLLSFFMTVNYNSFLIYMSIFFTVVFYICYIWFIAYIEKIGKKTLYIISIILFILIILGIKGSILILDNLAHSGL